MAEAARSATGRFNYNQSVHVWRERMNRWLRPLAVRCPLSPNAITSIALVGNLAGAACLAFAASDRRLFLAAAVITTLSGILDLFDGVVARAQGRSTVFGDFLDHFFDRVSDLAVIAGWVIGIDAAPLLGLGTVVAVALSGYIGTQIEATFHERSYEGTGRGEFVLALLSLPVIAYTLEAARISHLRFATLTITEWLTALLLVFAIVSIVQRLRLAARLAAERS